LSTDDIDVIIFCMGYNVDAVTKLASITGRQIRYWDTLGLVRPSLHKARGRGSRRLYSFEDLVELRTVARLLTAGISLQKVRRVVEQIRQVRDVDRPLAQLRFLTDGEGVFVASDDTKRYEDVLHGGQVVWTVPLDEVWRDTEKAVRNIGEPIAGTVRVGATSYDVQFEPDLEDGGWIVECPTLPGCVSQGETIAEVRKMIRDAIATIVAVEKHAPRRAASR
jgi:predicted RNase H-like HicB family nuclease/DNA-binding transcriptional MerR regulator